MCCGNETVLPDEDTMKKEAIIMKNKAMAGGIELGEKIGQGSDKIGKEFKDISNKWAS